MQPVLSEVLDQSGTSAPTGLASGVGPLVRRDGVTGDDVKNAVEKLVRDGVRVSLRSVRAELGTGSMTTIQRHLSALRSGQVPAHESSPSILSPHVTRALAGEIERVVGERTARLESDLKEAQSSLELLLEENEALSTACEESEGLLQSMRASMSEHLGTSTALRSQVQALEEKVEVVRSERESARQDLLLLQEHLRAAEERRTLVDSALEEKKQELAEARRELALSRQDAEEARRLGITLQAQLAAAKDAEESLKLALSKAQKQKEDGEEVRQRLSVLEVERTNLAERLTEARQALVRSEANLQQLLGSVLPGMAPPPGRL